jgi:lipopolysaccharide export LptBFGC system permease protein LptF
VGKNDLAPDQLLARAEELKQQAGKDPRLRDFYLGQSINMVGEYHSRFALPIGCLIMTILALPLSLQNRPGRGNPGLPLGLFFYVLYYLCISFSHSLTETSGLPVGLLVWAPNLLFGLLTLVILRSAARENSAPILERLLDLVAGLAAGLKRLTAGRNRP